MASQQSKKRLQPQVKIDSFFQPARKKCSGDGAVGSEVGGETSRLVAVEANAGVGSVGFGSLSSASSLLRADVGAACILSSTTQLTGPAEDVQEIVLNDVGMYIGQKIDDFKKCQLLQKPWVPPTGYVFPFSSHKNGRERRYLHDHHLKKYSSWLVYSPSLKGLFCKFCPWFIPGNVGGAHKTQPLQKLVTKPLKDFKDLAGRTGDLETHCANHYHQLAVTAGNAFIRSYHSPQDDVLNQVNRQRLDEIQENRNRLRPIVETVIFCGRNNLPLRGHRDDGKIIGDTEGDKQEGLFRKLLKFRVQAGDTTLQEHLKTASSRATYVSKTTQNQLISCCGEEISDQILDNVRNANFYAVMFDETTDASHCSQLSIVLRYVHKNQIREDFIAFVDAFRDLSNVRESDVYGLDQEDLGDVQRATTAEGTELSLTGKAIGQIVLRKLKMLKIPLKQCVGIGTDGCSVMQSEKCGAVSEVQSEATNAVRTPCYSHKLNNSLSRSNQVPVIKSSIAIMKETIAFFTFPKRREVLMGILGCQLSSLCETRWVERHDGVIQFSVDLPKIVKALDQVSRWKDPSTSSKASSLATALCEPQFVISMMCLSDVLSLTLPLSKILQKPSLDLKEGAKKVGDTISVLATRRAEVEEHFTTVWMRAEEIAEKLEIGLSIPRRCGRQLHRTNVMTDSPEEYYRLSTFIPLLDYLLADLRERFSPATLDVFQLPFLFPENIVKISAAEERQYVDSIIARFGGLLDVDLAAGSLLLLAEVSLWRLRWVREKNVSTVTTAVEVLAECDETTFPMISKLLLILATLPVSNATAERTFSTLRRLKTWVRCTMGEDRLVGLALLNIHPEISVQAESVITRFAKSSVRRHAFSV